MTEQTDTHGAEGKGWFGVDLDGVLAFYDKWVGPEHIGSPIPATVEWVRSQLAKGRPVRVLTARVSPVKNAEALVARRAIDAWVRKHVVPEGLPITHEKDHLMIDLRDDRVTQMEKNTGRPVKEILLNAAEKWRIRSDISTALIHLMLRIRQDPEALKTIRDDPWLDELIHGFGIVGGQIISGVPDDRIIETLKSKMARCSEHRRKEA